MGIYMQPADGINYYRLSQTDIDGQKTNLETKKIIYKGTKDIKLTVINTGHGAINIAVRNTAAGPVQMKIIDILGREILAGSFNPGTGSQSIQLQKGTYVLVVIAGNGQRISTKVIAD